MDNPRVPLEQKRVMIASKITKLQDELTAEGVKTKSINYRFTKVKELFEQYERLIEKLELTTPEDNEINLAEDVRTLFYDLMDQFEKLTQLNRTNHNNSHNVNISTNNTTAGNTTLVETQRLAKLPTTDLPKFDGNFENWLSFKNTFKTLIDTRNDLDDLNKFLYLRGCLTGSAANKLALFDASAENYTKAWDFLTKTYQKKRALICKHYDSILNLNTISIPTTDNLNKLIDDARQHINNLQSFQINITESLLVRILENKLPSEIKNKWQETFTDNDTLPTFESFCEFVSNFAFRLNTHRPDKHRDSDHSSKRRRNEHSNNNLKKQKTDTPVRALVTTSSSACPCCKHLHPLYKCYTFNALTVGERIKFVKFSKLCNNCLRVHKGTCTSSRCRVCKKFHHTTLHINQNVTQQTNNANVSKNNSAKIESPATVTTDKGSTA
ncbi:uncharacterized protein LOC123266006 [Cotesia glomerata]|uniref:uncharacterized protein LOC123266006 n=1 Tax=Cotesia glomerata TaxID=32391 RepID=UPI001D0332A1|nr:uncharacterized protein LOC123266006 [Cotesia glomerata]